MTQQQPARLYTADNIDYKSLMARRISRILLISNSYDGYTLEEDGRLESQINQEYAELNLSNPPSITRVKTTVEALDVLGGGDDFDLIITMYNVGELDVFEFSRIVKESRPELPVVLLTNYSKKISRNINNHDDSCIDHVFFWHGSADLIIAIIKLIEDRMNAPHDILEVGVQAILLVEDSVRYYSTYLPLIYKLILQQSNDSSQEALNEYQQSMRRRARPKILLATTYDEAVEFYEKYKTNLLGVISDVGFAVNSKGPATEEKLDAGIDLCRLVRSDNPQMPFIMQSSQKSIGEVARQLGVGFIEKYSKTLLLQLSDYIANQFAFGNFIFRDPQTGRIIGRAKDLRQLEELVREVPAAALWSAASEDQLSKWLLSRGLFYLGTEFRAVKATHFADSEQLRDFVVRRIHDYRVMSGQGIVARFDPESYSDAIWFARMGSGSLGGKARGLAFLNRMLQKHNFYDKYDGVRITIPRSIVITTDYFDTFIRENGLRYVINSDISDEDILSEFISSRLPQELVDNLRVFIKYARHPLAVRSSSRLEDSYYQPFAGIYSTYMVPPSDNEDQFLRLVGKAIKSVYASVFFASSRAYVTATGNVISEEKMAVIIQEVCGTEDGGYYFPTLSGIARSDNYYPIGDEKPSDGMAKICLGLGKAVVDGEQVLRFSPKYPKKVLQTSTPELALRETQKIMYALNLMPEKFKTSIDDTVNLERFEVSEARGFRNMRFAASTWDLQNQRLSDSPDTQGPKVITFAPILKYNLFPLAQILDDLLEMTRGEMNYSLEMEFAANLDVAEGEYKVFNLLQVRPVAEDESQVRIDWSKVDRHGELLYSESALGIGAIEGVRDIVYVKQTGFNAAHTRQIAANISAINARLKDEARGYVLIGPGRWGSSDPWLGIPVRWNEISQARVIVECGMKDYRIEPSQGTHFFQNLTALGVGYMTINPDIGDGKYHEELLNAMEAVYEDDHVRHVRVPSELFIFVDGMKDKGIIRLP